MMCLGAEQVAEQMAKLKSELDIVQQNCRVFNELLTELTPGEENPSDLELLNVRNFTLAVLFCTYNFFLLSFILLGMF